MKHHAPACTSAAAPGRRLPCAHRTHLFPFLSEHHQPYTTHIVLHTFASRHYSTTHLYLIIQPHHGHPLWRHYQVTRPRPALIILGERHLLALRKRTDPPHTADKCDLTRKKIAKPKLTFEEGERLLVNGSCLRCRERTIPPHTAKECIELQKG